ncbi:ABC transporter ATP-binding protein [Butyrivibrio sp. MC2021]|uniref:ABC transporter ATP-binding protein n=1 Tax=Butyrivibrio sp. MC2021 TaxID=1408306 RepID=UPI000569FEC1|nr:ABC transporter ATP-binding protein [Butyrivibrio sp. MC2021]
MKISELKAGYHKKIVVNGVTLETRKGEIISLIGPNGGGKSTLLRSISGELKPIGGAVYLEEQEIKNISLKKLSKKMAIVNTDRVKPEHMSAFDVVLSGRLPYSDGFGFFKDNDYAAAKKACELMSITELMDTPFLAMSDGQKQRTLIARAICQEPEYLIMDEPTSYLDIKHRLELMEVIKGLSEQGVTIIMSLHELELALEISDRCLLVKEDGNTLCQKPSEIIKSGVIQPLYGLSDAMYEKVKKQLISF